jgi:tRNA U34 5-methylaminomethyl-2-thiouridine-forming methyltransferase MnmC
MTADNQSIDDVVTASVGLNWQDGVIPVSQRFDDPYFSRLDGLAETRHVFLAGNDLPKRFCDGFHIAELGFGTGLNLVATYLALEPAPVRVCYTSFEAYPLAAPDIARALTHFPQARAVAEPFLAAWSQGQTRFEFGPISVEVILGDARVTLPQWQRQADAWFLDGFSPAKNPELWSPEMLLCVAEHTAPNGTFATYSAAGHVRRALESGGFAVQRQPGHGHKRHMTTGTLQ